MPHAYYSSFSLYTNPAFSRSSLVASPEADQVASVRPGIRLS